VKGRPLLTISIWLVTNVLVIHLQGSKTREGSSASAARDLSQGQILSREQASVRERNPGNLQWHRSPQGMGLEKMIPLDRTEFSKW
jgi:hypothetical protein